jgi:large subunit ribosomal protein L12
MSEYIHAALLLHTAEKKIDEKSLTKILSAAGLKPDEVRVKALVASLDGVDIEEAIKTTAAVPSVAVAPPSEEVKETPKKEKTEGEEKKEEEAIQGLGALFGA